MHRSPDEVLGVGIEDGLGFPAVGLDGFADDLLYVGGDGAGAVVVLIVSLTGIDVDEVILDGTLDAAWHIIIDS